MPKSLDDIRKKIDALDDQIHDLLMERADLIVDVLAAKKKAGTQIVQPAREAVMIRRLLKRHHGPLPEATIVGIWRELVGAVSLVQTGLKVAVSAPDNHSYCWDMARHYFGSVLPMMRMTSPLTAIAALHEQEASFAVVPWPQDGEQNPWWPKVFEMGQEGMRIVCALPYGIVKAGAAHYQDRALVVSRTDYASSGDDHSFIGLELDPSVSRARIMAALKEMGLEVLGINSRLGQAAQTLHFVEVKSFITADDEIMANIAEKFDGLCFRCRSLGGYPVPPVLKPLESKPLADIPAFKTATKTATQ